MEPITLILVPGFLGGLLVAAVVVLAKRRGRSGPSLVVPYRRDPISTDMINMASIKVAGVGGLGLVAMAAAVAFGVPRIGQSMALAVLLGTIAAVVMIVRRNKTGAMPSSGQGLGANTTLAIDLPPAASGDDGGVEGQAPTTHTFIPGIAR